MKIPFSGSKYEETKLCQNKFECCQLFREEGLPTLRPYLFSSPKQAANEEILEKLGRIFEYPLVVKPNRGSCGAGVFKVDKQTDLKSSIALAFKYDGQVLVEPYISDGVEVK